MAKYREFVTKGIVVESDSVEDTFEAAAAFAGVLQRGDVVILTGEMGAGKTYFTKGVVAHLGLDVDVTSPTFALVNEYRGESVTIYHLDLYRLDDDDALEDLALDELAERGILLIEWGERFSTRVDWNIQVTIDVSTVPTESTKLGVESYEGTALEQRRLNFLFRDGRAVPPALLALSRKSSVS